MLNAFKKVMDRIGADKHDPCVLVDLSPCVMQWLVIGNSLNRQQGNVSDGEAVLLQPLDPGLGRWSGLVTMTVFMVRFLPKLQRQTCAQALVVGAIWAPCATKSEAACCPKASACCSTMAGGVWGASWSNWVLRIKGIFP